MRRSILRPCLPVLLTVSGLVTVSCSSTKVRIGMSGEESTLTALAEAPDGEGLGEDFFTEDIVEETGAEISDPFRGYNRVMFDINDKIYQYLLRPVGNGYTWIMPDPVEQGVGNVFYNIGYPKRLVGNVLQAKWSGAARETGKFVVNSSFGIGGLFRLSDDIPSLQTEDDEDLGQAFASWGIGQGPYLVLPVVGPYSTRDAIGRATDILINPLTYIQETELVYGALTLDYINESPAILDNYFTLKDGSLDPYVSAKDAYVQFRNRKRRR